MTAGDAHARVKAEVLGLTAHVPAGRVATHGQFSITLKVMARHITTVFATLDDADRARVPWWRIVADGGAIGRHPLRDEQIRRLRDEGHVVSPAGIVQDVASVRVTVLSIPKPGAPKPPPLPAPRARSRGMKDKPKSSV